MRLLLATLGAALALGVSVGAEVYQWTDARGALHFTAELDRVPPAEREAARARARERPASRLQTYSRSPATPLPSPAAEAASVRPGALALSARGELRIPFRRAGTLMLVDAMLNDQLEVPFLVDTGASAVSIPDAVARRLGVRIDADTPRLTVQTAGGVVAEPLIRLDSVQLGGARVEQVDALVNSSMEVGLLGGSFFNNFVYQVDAAAGVITLRANENVRGGLSEEQWRERFGAARSEIERLERYLERNELARESRRNELDANLERLRDALDTLQTEANAAGVPRSWRE